MRYFLIIAGLLAIIVGLLNSSFAVGAAWLQIGAVFLAIGLATCEIVAAIARAATLVDHAQQLERFRNAAQSGDSKTMVNLLKDGGIPEDVAERTARSVMVNPGSVKIRSTRETLNRYPFGKRDKTQTLPGTVRGFGMS